jgi:hypothetical protein
MNRRAFVQRASVLGGAASLGLLPQAFAQSNPPATPLTVIYIGGQDCPSCAQWKGQYKAKWEASPEFKRVKWVAVDPPSLLKAYESQNWPDDQKPILAKLPSKSGTPRFVVVKDGAIISNHSGVRGWQTTFVDIQKNA